MKHATKLISIGRVRPSCVWNTLNRKTSKSKSRRKLRLRPGLELATRGANIFVNAPNLMREQREQFMDVHTEGYQEAATLRSKLTQAKQALFKSLVAPSANQKEISKPSEEMIKHFTEMASTKM